MKLIESEKPDGFEPFNITLRLETPEEARLLWHVFNHAHLRSAIFGPRYRSLNSCEPVAETFSGDDGVVKDFIASRVSI